MLYRVRWEIDLEADTPEEAARQALDIHRDPESMATLFDVRPAHYRRGGRRIDAAPAEEQEPDPTREVTDAMKEERRHGDPRG